MKQNILICLGLSMFILSCKQEDIDVRPEPFVKVDCTIDDVLYQAQGIYYYLADPYDRTEPLMKRTSDETGEVNFGEVLPANYVIYAGAYIGADSVWYDGYLEGVQILSDKQYNLSVPLKEW